MSYTDVTWADEYFAMRAFADAWESAGDNKQKYLTTATRTAVTTHHSDYQKPESEYQQDRENP